MIELKNIRKTENLEDTDIDRLIEVCQNSFSGEDSPTEKEAEEHIVSGSNLVVASSDDELVGFSSTKPVDYEEPFILQYGLAVDQDFQGENLGELLLDLVAVLDMDNMDTDTSWIGGRTQNPFYVGYIEDRGGYPRDAPTPPEFMKAAEHLSQRYNDSEFKDHVLSKTYSQPLYSDEDLEKSSELLNQLVDENFDPWNGDAIIAVTYADIDDLEEMYLENKSESCYEISESLEEHFY